MPAALIAAWRVVLRLFHLWGRFVTVVLLAAVYVVVVCPLWLVLTLLGRRPLPIGTAGSGTWRERRGPRLLSVDDARNPF